MSTTPKVYAVCGKNCFYETLTREQILTAIMQAVETGEIGDINAGFVQTIKTINGVPLKFFVGSQSLYDTLSEEDKQNLFALITDDTSSEELMRYLNGLADRVSVLETKDAQSHVATADRADYATRAGTATSATTATRMASLQAGTDNTYRNVWFSDVDEPTLPRKDNDFTYNPSKNTLKVKKIDTTSTVKCAVSDEINLKYGVVTDTGVSVPEGKTLDDLVLITVGAPSQGIDPDFDPEDILAVRAGIVGYGVPLGPNAPYKYRFSVENLLSKIHFEAEFMSDDRDDISMTIGVNGELAYIYSLNRDTGTISYEATTAQNKDLLNTYKVYLTFYFK